MTYEQKQEVIKALVSGLSQAEAADYAGVSVEDIDGAITSRDIDAVRKDLTEMGWTE